MDVEMDPSTFSGIEKCTIRVDQLPESERADYLSYLENRVFEQMMQIRPWGINAETAKWLLIDALVEEEIAKGYPGPSPEDIDQILNTCWNMSHVGKAQGEDEMESLKVFDTDCKHIKQFSTTPSAVGVETRLFTDFGADVGVLREVALHLQECEGDVPNKLSAAYDDYVRKKCPTLKHAGAETLVVDVAEERKKVTYRRFSEEDSVGPDRWDWLKDKQESLGKNEAIEALMKTLFSPPGEVNSGQPVSGASVASRPTRNNAVTIVVPSSTSRLTRQSLVGGVDSPRTEEVSRKRPAAGGSSRLAKTSRRGKL